MGTAYIPSAPQAHIRYHGTQSVERVQLFGIAERPNAERELLWEITEPELDTIETLDLEAHIDLSAPNSTAIWIEAIQSDGEKAWSSPIWLSSSCDDPEMTDILGLCDPQNPSTSDTASNNPPPAQNPKSESRCQATHTSPHFWLGFVHFYY